MAERSKALVLKTSRGQPLVGSNPTASARSIFETMLYREFKVVSQIVTHNIEGPLSVHSAPLVCGTLSWLGLVVWPDTGVSALVGRQAVGRDTQRAAHRFR